MLIVEISSFKAYISTLYFCFDEVTNLKFFRIRFLQNKEFNTISIKLKINRLTKLFAWNEASKQEKARETAQLKKVVIRGKIIAVSGAKTAYAM